MAIDRRKFSLGAIAVLTAACAKVPKGNARARGDFWSQFRERFITPSGRVIDNGNGNISHSEGQGYGMLLAALHDDRAAFDALAAWTQQTLGREDMALHAWKYDPREPNPVPDRNNASDGDILIAWALSLGGRKWKMRGHIERSAQVRRAIRQKLVVERAGQQFLLPGLQGFVESSRIVVNPSYVVWPALDHFRKVDGDGPWATLIDDSARFLASARFGAFSLPTDWVDVSANGNLAPARDKPARFGFDAVRVPLYAMAGHRRALAEPALSWWQSHASGGQAVPAWIDVNSGELAPYGLSPGGMAVVAAGLGRAMPAELSTDYYAAVLQLLVASIL